jgi:hypothetical protein
MFEMQRLQPSLFDFDPWKEPLRASRLGHALALNEIQRLRARVEELERCLKELASKAV